MIPSLIIDLPRLCAVEQKMSGLTTVNVGEISYHRYSGSTVVLLYPIS
jgi:hypothetical protein